MRFSFTPKPVAVLSLLFSFSETSAAAESRPYLMITVGDSMSAAFIANTNAQKPSDDLSIASNGSQVNGLSLKHRIAQLGNQKKTLSWSSGSDIPSHYIRLKNHLRDQGASLEVKNVAKTGAMAEYLPHETKNILKAWKSGKYRAIKYVTLLIGANDACNKYYDEGTPDESFTQSLHTFFKTMASIQQSEPMHILVSSIPRIPDVAQPEIFDHKLFLGLTCRKFELNIAHFCDPLLNWTNPKEYQNRITRVERKNAILRQVVDETQIAYPNLRVKFSESLYRQSISLNRMAADCFHPNRSGHTELSDLLWNDQPWFH